MSDFQEPPAEEIVIRGVSASPGLVMGKAHVHKKVIPVIRSGSINEEMIPAQIDLFQNAQQMLQGQWEKLLEKETNEESQAILSAQIQIIADPELSAQVKLYIREERDGAQKAISKAFDSYIKLLSESGSDMMQNRLIDLTDIRDRLIEATGKKNEQQLPEDADILVSDEISPREVIKLSHQNVKGIIMEKGGHTSHAAIIARSMGIPTVVGAKGVTQKIDGGAQVCLNAGEGLVIINPSENTCTAATSSSADEGDSLDDQIAICEKPSLTIDEKPFVIRANIEFPEELPQGDQFCAEGIGLLRTESVYIDRKDFSSVPKQVGFYKEVMEKTEEDQPVIIRLFDVGGDKFPDDEISENNPFLGWRGIRMLLDERELLRDQLKAILLTAHQFPGRIKILIPMVSTLNEVTEVKKELQNCREELANEGTEITELISIGMMVEVPSAAINAGHFAQHVDFFSIGTNDLTQYLLAVDRGNALISYLYDQRHPALWKMIHHVIETAEEHDIEVDVCGELASYPVPAACLVGMGVAALSMSPSSIPAVKKMLIQNSMSDMQQLAEQTLKCDGVEEIRALFANWKKVDA